MSVCVKCGHETDNPRVCDDCKAVTRRQASQRQWQRKRRAVLSHRKRDEAIETGLAAAELNRITRAVCDVGESSPVRILTGDEFQAVARGLMATVP